MDEHDYPNEGESQSRRIDPDVILEIWHRRRWVGILVFGAVLACAASAALSLPDLYRASTKVLVDRQEVSETFVRPTVTEELEPRIQTIRQQVMSRERLANLITTLDLYPEDRQHRPIEAVVERMRRDVDLKLEGLETNGRNATVAFTVSYNGRDPMTTAKVANTLASYYVEENSKGRKRQAARTAAFLNRQVESLKAELEQQDVKTGDFIRRHNTDLPQQLGANESALSRLSARLQINAEQQLRQAERRERIQREISDATTGVAAADTRLAESELAKLKQQLAAARNQYSDRYPEVARLTNEVAVRETQLKARRSSSNAATPSSTPAENAAALTEVNAQLKALQTEETVLRSAIGSFEKRVASTPSRAMEMERLSRGFDTTRDRYLVLLKAYQDAQVAASLELGDGAEEFRILDPAIPPREAVAPNRLWLLFMSLVAAAIAGAIGIMVAEKLDSSFHAPDELRAFVKTPILATIPLVFTSASSRRRRYRRALAASAAILVLTLLAAGSWYVATGNEMITRLTTRGA